MMWSLGACRTAAAGLLLAWTAAAAQSITVAGLQRLLQDAPKRAARFHEIRESKWLSTPVETSGYLTSSATMLEKVVEHPRRETWQILDDRMQLIVPGSTVVKQFMFSRTPAVAVLANALRHVMAGDLPALHKDFWLVPSGDERLWTLQLTPRGRDIALYLRHLELQGSGPNMLAVVILESQGDRTTMRLIYEP